MCFQRKGQNLEITDYIKQITHIAGVNSIQGEFNSPGVFISLNIIYISNEHLIEHLSLNFILKKKERKRKWNFNFIPAGLLVFTKCCWLRKAFHFFFRVLSLFPRNIVKNSFRRWIIFKDRTNILKKNFEVLFYICW